MGRERVLADLEDNFAIPLEKLELNKSLWITKCSNRIMLTKQKSNVTKY